jgi:nicotinamidase/pyrazinamidase
MSTSERTMIRMGKMTLEDGNALIVADVQRDFLPGGSLAVPDAESIVAVLNRYLAAWSAARLPTFLSRCWHPSDHCSFRAQGGAWPAHCVAGSAGAEFAPGLEIPSDSVVISKAADAGREVYSAFEGTDLDLRLRRLGTTRVFVGGIATDYCVLNTVRDAIERGYTTFVLSDAVRAVDAHPGDGHAAEEEMARLGAQRIDLETLGL